MDPAKESNPKPNSTLNEPAGDVQTVVVINEQEKDLLTWTAKSRPFKRRNSQFYVTIFAICGVIGLVLFLAEGIMPVLLIIALVFLYYVLSTVEPEKIEYQLTNKGIKIMGKRTDWQYMNKFWFSERFGSKIMIIETNQIPGRMEVVIEPEIQDKLKKEISNYIPFEEAPSSNYDKITNWFTSKLPGNE
jgi:hypothetical protein